MGLHKNITEGDLHVPGFIDSSDPGAVGAGRLWIDTSGGTGNWVTKIRNDADDGWEEVSGSGGGGGATDYDDLTSYKDLVTLQKSGAGYPSGSNETALYDGDGNQIIPRTAVRHWLDPHPDAASFAETWEFSTKGDMTQGQLETAGWTFTNCTAEVANGVLWLTTVDASTRTLATLTVSLSGDFDFLCAPAFGYEYGDDAPYSANLGVSMGVADTSNDLIHYAYCAILNGRVADNRQVGATYSTFAGGTFASYNTYATPFVMRILRASGTVYLSGGAVWPSSCIPEDDTGMEYHGYGPVSTVVTAATFDRLVISPAIQSSPAAGSKAGCLFLRRFQ